MITVIDQGIACAHIVLSPEPQPIEHFAAAELQKYLRQMTGVELPIDNRPIDDRPAIHIGAAAHRDTLDLSEEALGFDGYLVRTDGRDLLLTGRQPYSCLYAVYHLLERYLGCGFFEDGDQAPSCDAVTMPPIDDVEKPRFAWRGHNHCMQDAYAGQRWWDAAQLTAWVEFLAKKRCNNWMVERMAEHCGITARAAAKMGIDIPLQPWQEERARVLRAVYAHARMLGVRITYYTGLCCENGIGDAGTYCYADGMQLRAFVRGWNAAHDEQIPTFEYHWCDCISHVLDPRSPITQRFLAACVEAYTETLGTDHLYQLWLPSEGFWASTDHDEMNRLTYAMAGHVIDAIKRGDPQAFIFSPPPFPYAATFEAQQRAVRDAGLTVAGDQWLNAPGRMHDFLMCDYYWNLPWVTGMSVQCGKATNPSADLELCLRNARELAADPRAAQCIGFNVRTEMSHKMILAMDFFFALAWDPAAVTREDYLRRWTLRRYGPAGERLQRSTRLLADSVYSSSNSDLYNGPLYRHLRGTYLPGLTPMSVKRLLGYLPALREAVLLLLAEYPALGNNPLYRFDLVDYARTYLSGLFNDRFARARMAFRAGNRQAFEDHAAAVEELMRDIATLVGVEPTFRLQTYDAWAERWPEIVPGEPNAESNWLTFTALISRDNLALIDYMAEDLTEIVTGYYLPRVQRYLGRMRALLNAGQDISGEINRRFAVSDWAPAHGTCPWSPYGNTSEPELLDGDFELAAQIIRAGTLSGQYAQATAPLDTLTHRLLARYPVPDDLEHNLSTPDPTELVSLPALQTDWGETCMGFHTPADVERVQTPEALGFLVQVEKVNTGYNVMRGEVSAFRVHVSDYLTLTRQPDAPSPVDGHAVTVFRFEADGIPYLLRYDAGSTAITASLIIAAAEN